MTRLLSFFGGWQGWLALFFAGTLLGGYGVHRWDAGQKAIGEVKQARQAVKIAERQINITYQVSLQFEKVKLDDETATTKRLEQIPVHITPDSDRACVVPVGFVRVFNAATHGPVPDAASGPDDSASGLALSDIARVETENYGQYDLVAHQLEALQDWVKQQQEGAPK